MCITTNLWCVIFCVLQICVPYFNTERYVSNVTRSTRVLGNFFQWKEDVFVLKVSETLTILCTGAEANDFYFFAIARDETIDNNKMFSLYNLQFVTMKINDTTKAFVVNKTEVPKTLYCGCREKITLIFDGEPDLTDFHCVSQNFKFLNCTWATANLVASFNLYVVDDHGQLSSICDIPMHRVGTDFWQFSCIWDKTRTPRYDPHAVTLHLLLEYCNFMDCFNKTYVFNHTSIVKFKPPIIKLLSDESDLTIRMMWRIPSNTKKLINGIQHRANYRMFGSQPREIFNISNQPDLFSIELISYVTDFYGLMVRLPCSSRNYELRVAVKTEQAGDEYWSDYATAFYTTPKTSEADDDDCAEQKTLETHEIIYHDIKEFRDKFDKEQKQLKNQIKELNAKVARKEGKIID